MSENSVHSRHYTMRLPYLISLALLLMLNSIGINQLNAQDCQECQEIFLREGGMPPGTVCQPGFAGNTPGGLTCLDNEKCIEVGRAFEVNPPETIYIFSWGDGAIDTLTHQQLLNLPMDGGIFGDQRLVCHPYEQVTCPDPEARFPVSVKVLNPNGGGEGCTNSIAAGEIRVLAPIEVDFTTDNIVVCTNEAFNLYNQSIEGYNSDCTKEAQYQWDFNNDGTIDAETEGTGMTVNHPGFSTPGVKEIRLVGFQNPEGVCGPDEIVKTITVLSVPKAKFDIGDGSDLMTVEECNDELQFTFSNPTDGCAEVSLPLVNKTEDVNPTTEFVWEVSPSSRASFANSDFSEVNNTITFTEAGEYKVSLRVTDNCADGQTGSSVACINVKIKDAPELIIDAISPVCAGGELVAAALDGTLAVNMNDALSINWQVTDSEGAPITIPENGKDTLRISGMEVGIYSVALTYENSCGEVIADPVTVNVNPSPEISLDTDKSIVCTDETITITASDASADSYEWYSNDVLISGATSSTLTVQQSEAGDYEYYTIIQKDACIVTSEKITITVTTPPSADPIIIDQEVFCEGEEVNFTLEAQNIQPETADRQWQSCVICDGTDWTDIEGATNNAYNGNTAGSYRLALSLAEGCTSFTEPVDITVRPLPTWQPNITNPTVCAGESITIILEGGAENYIWTPEVGLNTSEGNTVVITPNVDIEYTIKAISGSCERDTTLAVRVLPIPEVIATPSQSLICPGDTVDIEVSGGSSYEWIANPFLEATSETQGIAFPQETTIFYIVGLNEQGCADTVGVEIEVRSIPGLSAEDESVCISDPAFSLELDLPENVTGTWSAPQLPAGSLSPEGVFDPQIAGVDSDGHTVTFTYQTDDPLACASSLTKKVFVHPLPEPEFSVPPVVCVGEEVNFSNQTTGNFTYRWKVEDAIYNTENPTHTFQTVAEASTIWLYAQSPEGCTDSISQTVQVVEAPRADFSMSVEPASLCGPVTVSFTNLSEGELVSYAWDFGNGESSTEINPSPVVFEPGILGDTAYVVTLSVTNACTTVDLVDTVEVRPQPVANFLFEKDTICADYPLRIHNYSTGLAEEFEWYFGFDQNMAPFTTDEAGTFTQAFPYTGDTDTTYYISLVTKNDCGTDTLTRPLVVTPNEVEAFYNINTLQGCGPLEVTLTSNQVAGTSNNITIAWGDGDTTQGNIVAQHMYQNPGTYYPKLIVQNGCSIDACGGSGDSDCGLAIQVYPTPVASFEAPEHICISDSVSLTNASRDGVDSEWDFGDGRTYSGTSPPPFTYATSGTYTISLTTANQNGCRSTAFEKTIVVNPLPVPDFTLTESYCQDEAVQVENASSGATAYQWIAEGLGVISTEQHLNYQFSQEGEYQLTLRVFNGSELDGCFADFSQTIRITRPAEPFFEMEKTSDCEGDRINFTNLTTYPSDGSGVFEWDFGNGATYTGTDNIPSQLYPYPEDGTSSYTITLTVQSEGCTKTYQQELEVTSVAGVVRPEGNKPLAFTPTATTNNKFRLNFVQLTSVDLRVYSREGVEVFRTDDPNESWDGYYRGELAPAGLYNVQVSYTNCAGYSDNDVLQLYLLLDEF